MVIVQKEIKKVTIRPNGSEVQIRPPVPKTRTIDFLLIAGGGGGSQFYGGGGGAGGTIQCNGCEINPGEYNIIIGLGGSGIGTCCDGNDGGNSCFGELVAYGGGGGGGYPYRPGHNGGSGGGAGYMSGCASGTGIAGQGHDAGINSNNGGGGGGGAGGAGCNASTYCGGMGGIGIQSDIDGTCKWYAGGGSGFDGYYGCSTAANSGGTASGYGATSSATICGAGGGGTNKCNTAGMGGNGLFVLRHLTACGYNISGGCCYTCGSYTIHCFTSNGTLCIN